MNQNLGIPNDILGRCCVMLPMKRLVLGHEKVTCTLDLQFGPGSITFTMDFLEDDPEEAALFARHGVAPPSQLFAAQGCEACGGSGHAGRFGIYEIAAIPAELRSAIAAGADETQIAGMALAPAERLAGQGLAAAAAGTVSLEEVLRVAGDAS